MLQHPSDPMMLLVSIKVIIAFKGKFNKNNRKEEKDLLEVIFMSLLRIYHIGYHDRLNKLRERAM